MKSILKIIKGKPSVALQAMVTGLLKQSKRKDFKIDMSTFGTVRDNICFGCAATCTLQQITKINLTQRTMYYHAKYQKFDVDVDEMSDFEDAIDDACCGHMADLFRFCGKFDRYEYRKDTHNFQLSTFDWNEGIPKVRAYIKELKKRGL